MSDKLFFDDVRLAPGGDVANGGEWHVARKVEDAIRILREHQEAGEPIRYASLDHDMGMSYNYPQEWELTQAGTYHCPDGCDLVRAMWKEGLWPEEIYVHSANPWGRQAMREYIAERNGVPEVLIPYTEQGFSEKQKMYTEMWESIHSWENQGFGQAYGCEADFPSPVTTYREWEAQLDYQLRLWEKMDEERNKRNNRDGDDDDGAWTDEGQEWSTVHRPSPEGGC